MRDGHSNSNPPSPIRNIGLFSCFSSCLRAAAASSTGERATALWVRVCLGVRVEEEEEDLGKVEEKVSLDACGVCGEEEEEEETGLTRREDDGEIAGIQK